MHSRIFSGINALALCGNVMSSVVGTIVYHIACRESKCFLFTNDDGFCVRAYLYMYGYSGTKYVESNLL